MDYVKAFATVRTTPTAELHTLDFVYRDAGSWYYA